MGLKPVQGWTTSMEGEPPIGMLPDGTLALASDNYDDWDVHQIDDSVDLIDAAPRTLYVRRDVLNAAEIAAHFHKQGVVTLKPEQMHVTIAFSHTPVDWMKIGEEYPGSYDKNGGLVVGPGGPRQIDLLGAEKDALVLLFSSTMLQWRHEEIVRKGASWDWAEYQPHITISYLKGEKIDLETIDPYRGAIKFGPEIFEEVVEDWKETLDKYDPNQARAPKGDPDGGKWTPAGGSIGKLDKHTQMRDYTEKEMDWEYEREYMVYSKPHFPTAFSSRLDFQTKYDAAPLVHLSIEELRGLDNSMASSGLNKGEKWVQDTFGHRRDVGRIVTALNEGKTAPPIVLNKGGRDWLMAGQTRLAAGLALGKSVPVKRIKI